MRRIFASPMAFKASIDTRLRREAQNHDMSVDRVRMLMVYERFVARVQEAFPNAATLKGGLALEFRLGLARSTKDVDFRFTGPPDTILPKLQVAARMDLRDFLLFEVTEDPKKRELRGPGVVYDGCRFKVRCTLAGKVYGRPFGIDVAFGDPIVGEPVLVAPRNMLGFMGIETSPIRCYPPESHVAEKLHAYTLPRDVTNSRVKDLPDLALLATEKDYQASLLREAIENTFSFRRSHNIPDELPPAPASWDKAYTKIAADNGLAWRTLSDVWEAAQTFLNPVLARPKSLGAWSKEAKTWTEAAPE